MSEDQDEDYNVTHKAFLQALISKSTITFEEAQSILAAILTAHTREESRPQDITQETFESYIEAVNTAISDFDMEIRSTVHQTTRQRTYALINSVSDPVTQLATGFPPDEISYIKRVLDAMFDTNNTLRNEVMAIQPIQATKLHRPPVNRRETIDGETQGSTGTHITILQAEKVLSSMVEQGWFEKSRKNYYSLSPRALMELRGWLQETYNDEEDDDEGGEGDIPKIKFCHACKEIVTYGQRCPKLLCLCRFHDTCADGFFRTQRSKACPGCKTEWTGQDFVGERAAVEKKKGQKSRPSDVSRIQAESSTTPARRGQQQNGLNSEDDDG